MPIYWRPCLTETCTEPATDGSFCASCAAFNRELEAIRQREVNDAIYTRYMRSNWKAS